MSAVSKKGTDKGFPPHDPTAIAYLIKPELFETELFPVIHTNLNKKKYRKFDFSSKTLVDEELKAKEAEISKQEKQNWVNWALKIKSAEFMELLLERLI
jgi:inosine-uridine nucleoside N-ribohydrolase